MSEMARETPGNAASAVLRAEVLAARLEAAARAEPEVGNLWRSELALAEAVASACLEGVRLSERDLLPRVALNGAQGADPAGSELALGLIRVLKAPGDPLRHPVDTVRRFERAAGQGRGAALASDAGRSGRRATDAEIATLFAGLRPGDMPILSAARAAAGYAQLTARANPVIERLVFVAVEGALRGAAAPAGGPEDPFRGLSGRVDAGWVALPALALSHGRFQPWSPGSGSGLIDLACGLDAVLAAEIGRFGLARDWWRRGLAAGTGRRGSSRLTDAVRAFTATPVLSSALLAEALGLSLRGALNLLEELAGQGLVQEITRRRTARIWAVPGLAARLAPPGGRVRRRLAGQGGGPRPEGTSPSRREAQGQEMEQAFAELEAAFARVDLLLERAGS